MPSAIFLHSLAFQSPSSYNSNIPMQNSSAFALSSPQRRLGQTPASLSLILILLYSPHLSPQHTTYSKAEEVRAHQLNDARFRAKRSSSVHYYRAVIDSIQQFLHKYPRTIFKSGLLSYQFELTAAISSSPRKTDRLADSILTGDSMAVTKLWLAEIMIERKLNPERGTNLIREILPSLSNNSQLYRAYRLLAKQDAAAGKLALAEAELDRAIQLDSTRYDAWFDYLALARAREDLPAAARIQQTLVQLERNELGDFEKESSTSPNLFRNVSHIMLKNVKGGTQSLSRFHNRILVLNFFGIWCRSCLAELPQLERLSNRYPGVTFLFINTGDDIKDVRKFLERSECRFMKTKTVAVLDSTFSGLEVNLVPRTLIVDRTGTVRFDYLGYVKGEEEILGQSIQKILSEH